MYSRNYYKESEGVRIPEKYDGTAMLDIKDGRLDDEIIEAKTEEEHKTEPVFSRNDNDQGYPTKADNRFDIGSLLGRFLPKDIKLGSFIPSFGTEELLIVALAAFLFFSKSGDRECALMLLLLIFIN